MRFKRKNLLPPEVVEANNRLISSHPGWRLGTNGQAAPRPAWLLLICVVTGLALYSLFDPAQIVLNPDGLGGVASLAYLLMFAFMGAMLWLWGALFLARCNTDPRNSLTRTNLVVGAAVLLAAAWVVSSAAIFRGAPLIATRVAGSPLNFEQRVEAIRLQPCGKPCFFSRLTGHPAPRYRLYLADYPNTNAPIRLTTTGGLTVLPQGAWLRKPEYVRLGGLGNWFALRISSLEKTR